MLKVKIVIPHCVLSFPHNNIILPNADGSLLSDFHSVHIEDVRATVSCLCPEKPVFSRVCVRALRNYLTLDKILLLTRCGGASAIGALLLDTVVCLTSEVSSRKLPRGPRSGHGTRLRAEVRHILPSIFDTRTLHCSPLSSALCVCVSVNPPLCGRA